MEKLGVGAVSVLASFWMAACEKKEATVPNFSAVHREAAAGTTLTEVLETGKEEVITPRQGSPSLKIRRLEPNTSLHGDIDPKFVAIGEIARIRSGLGGWIDGSRTVLESDFLSYVSAAKSAGATKTSGPQLVVEIARNKPSPDAMELVLECAAAAGFTDVWVTQEPPAPPRNLPVNPAKPMAPTR